MFTAVPESWIETCVAPALLKALDGAPGRVLWLLTEHPAEGDFMLERLKEHCNRKRQKHRELCALSEDASLVWSDLTGTPDDAGVLGELEPATVVLVRGGAHLDEDWLGRHAGPLARLARGCQSVFVVPMLHGLYELRGDYLRHGEVVSTPRFSQEPREDRIAAGRLVVAAVQSEQEPISDDFLRDLIEAGPSSRTELAQWLEWYSSQGSEKRFRIPPNIPRLRVRPRPIRGRSALEAHFRVLVDGVQRNDELFMQWQGRALFRPVREATHPFSGIDSRFWFVSCVSYLACLFFDTADPTIRLLSRFKTEGGDVVATSTPSPFMAGLRALRTRFQHGMDWSRPDDTATRQEAEQWFLGACGVATPRREHWRRLCEVLLESWGKFNDQLLAVLSHIPHAPSRDVLETQMLAESRLMPRHEWSRLIFSVIQEIAPHLDGEGLLAKRMGDFRKRLRDSAVRADEVPAEARRIVELVVAEECARLPVTAKDLLDAGIPTGPQVGALLREAERTFKAQPTLDRTKLLAMLLEKDG